MILRTPPKIQAARYYARRARTAQHTKKEDGLIVAVMVRSRVG